MSRPLTSSSQRKGKSNYVSPSTPLPHKIFNLTNYFKPADFGISQTIDEGSANDDYQFKDVKGLSFLHKATKEGLFILCTLQ